MEKEALWAILHNAFLDGNNRHILALLEEKADPEELLGLSFAGWKARLPMLGEDAIGRLVAMAKEADPEKTAEYMHKRQIRMVGFYDEEYPHYLRNIDNPPPFLYLIGAEINESALHIAMVGSRTCTEYGKKAAFELASELSRNGVCIVSGLARGIDAASHGGALESAGGTIAVLGTGVDKIYPGENRRLAEDILAHPRGTIISEFPLSAKPLKWHFPMRNRIISGLSDGLVVVEAGRRSGSLISAELALEQGKEVFAVPGSIFAETSVGCNNLLRDGAKLVAEVSDILDEFGVEGVEAPKKVQVEEMDLSEDERTVLQYITAEPIDIDELGYLSKMAVPRLMNSLSLLEIEGLVKQLAGRKYMRLG